MKHENLDKLIETIRILRSPKGCEWDREQTHKSLRPNMLEEAYEAVDAIDSGDMANLREELGDVLLQVLLHSQIADDEGEFNIDDVSIIKISASFQPKSPLLIWFISSCVKTLDNVNVPAL
jgi:tetrapyrrole methylase family protein/MazG family protein